MIVGARPELVLGFVGLAYGYPHWVVVSAAVPRRIVGSYTASRPPNARQASSPRTRNQDIGSTGSS